MAYVATTPRVQPLYRGTQIVWFFLNLVEVLLLFRFILRLLGANPAATFTNIIYSLTGPLVAPFVGVFRALNVAGSTIEWSSLLAMFIYWLLAWGIVRLIVMSKPVSVSEADYKLGRQDVETY